MFLRWRLGRVAVIFGGEWAEYGDNKNTQST
jgi:hypothetical protein